MYIRNIADITPDWSYICSTADIPELYAISKGHIYEIGYIIMEANLCQSLKEKISHPNRKKNCGP
jgi:hypothetical protein